MSDMTATEHRNAAKAADQEAYDSFERCDTDGFLSQWACGLTANLHRRQAEIMEAGGVAEFPALFNLDGQRVRAKLIDGKYGPCWAICDNRGRYTGEFVGAFPARESTMERKGFREGREVVEAYAFMNGTGHGLSGRAWVATGRKDDGYPADAVDR
jgi:hypothetical protein